MHELVPMYAHAAHYQFLKSDIDVAVERVFTSGRLDWGPEVPAFEAEFARWVGAAHAVGAGSGTSALKLALIALGIGPGDEVITVPNSDIATTAAIHHVGATAVWVDVEPDTLNMDPALVEVAITGRTRALLPAHLYGHPAAMPELVDLAHRHALAVIEDACLALGSSVAGRTVGTWGDVGCFSHAPTKHLGANGSAGTAVTNSSALAEQMVLLSGYGQRRERSSLPGPAGEPLNLLVEGLNERLDEVQAAILRVKLPYVAAWTEARRGNARAYTAALRGTSIEPPVERPGCRHTYRNYVVRVPERDLFRRRLAEAGVATAMPYAPPLHLQPAYRRLGHRQGAFPVAEAACERLLSIPVGPHLTTSEVDRVIAALLEADAER